MDELIEHLIHIYKPTKRSIYELNEERWRKFLYDNLEPLIKKCSEEEIENSSIVQRSLNNLLRVKWDVVKTRVFATYEFPDRFAIHSSLMEKEQKYTDLYKFCYTVNLNTRMYDELSECCTYKVQPDGCLLKLEFIGKQPDYAMLDIGLLGRNIDFTHGFPDLPFICTSVYLPMDLYYRGSEENYTLKITYGNFSSLPLYNFRYTSKTDQLYENTPLIVTYSVGHIVSIEKNPSKN